MERFLWIMGGLTTYSAFDFETTKRAAT